MATLLKLELSSHYTRPIFLLKKKVSCLIDTGADTPVWTAGKGPLIAEFGAEPVPDKLYLLSGFGKAPETAPVLFFCRR